MFDRIQHRNSLFGMFPFLADWHQAWQLAKSYKHWKHGGLPVPAPHPVKRALLLREALRIKAGCFVETGTFTGDTVWFMRDKLAKVYSIEVQPQLAALASGLFRNDPRVEIIEGDSATALADLVKRINGTTLFWLDGHYSAGLTARGASDCPIYDELRCVFGKCRQRWVVLIDDARCFGSEKDYPSLPELAKFVESVLPGAEFRTEHDMIRIVPPA